MVVIVCGDFPLYTRHPNAPKRLVPYISDTAHWMRWDVLRKTLECYGLFFPVVTPDALLACARCTTAAATVVHVDVGLNLVHTGADDA